MKRKSLIKIASPCLGLPLLLASCSTALPKLEAPRMEQRLLAAGFVAVPADTAEKATKLQALPPYKLVKRRTKDTGEDVYVYADPTNCTCAYIGDPAQYAVFKDALSSMSDQEADALNAHMDTQEQMETATDTWDPL